MNKGEEEFGEERFEEFVNSNLCVDPADFHRDFLNQINLFSQGVPLKDDLTLLSLRFS
jgi:sigma-B regulation protein RsbU (phosphoserine phosphatase)